MSTFIYNQDFHDPPDVDHIASGMEEAARSLRATGECRVYLGGSVFAEIESGGDDPGIWIEV